MLFALIALPLLATCQEPEPLDIPQADPPGIVLEESGDVDLDQFEDIPEEIFDEPIEEILEEIQEDPWLQEPEFTDAEAEALAAWLGDGSPDWDTPTGRFLQNLELGMNLDLIAEFTEKRGSVEEYNDLRVRSAQLNFASPVAGIGRAFFTLDLADGGDGSDLILREAGALMHDIAGGYLPGRVDLRVGKYLADLGAWNTVFANEFPAPSLDGTRRAFLGGNLVMSGAELHHQVPFADGVFRWSLGLAGDTESQDVDRFGNGLDSDPAITPFGRRGAANWTATMRGNLQFDLGDGMRARFGASGLYAPEEILFTDLGGGVTEREEVRHSLVGVDAGFLYEIPNSEQSHEVSIEVWLNDSQFRDPGGAYVADESRGSWALYRFVYDPQWSAGALFSRTDVLGLSTVDLDASYHSGFLTYNFSGQTRVTGFVTHSNPGQIAEKFFTVGAQLTMDLGASRDNAIPRWN